MTLYCPMRQAGQMTIGKTYPRLYITRNTNFLQKCNLRMRNRCTEFINICFLFTNGFMTENTYLIIALLWFRHRIKMKMQLLCQWNFIIHKVWAWQYETYWSYEMLSIFNVLFHVPMIVMLSSLPLLRQQSRTPFPRYSFFCIVANF